MKLKKIIEYGLYLLVFLLPIQTRLIVRAGEINGAYFEYGTISLYGTDILLVLLLLLATLLVLSERFQYSISNIQYPINIQLSIFKYNFYWLAIGFLDLLIFISIFYSPDKLVALQKYFWFILGLGLFWLIIKAVYSRAKLIYSFLAGALLQAFLGIWQFLSQSSFSFKWLGIARHSGGDLGASVVETLSGERWLRAYGGLDHPNVLGGYLVIGMLFFFFLIIKSERKKEFKSEIGNLKLGGVISDSGFMAPKIVSFFCFTLIAITGLFVSFSRSAWIALIFGILIFLILAIKQKDISMKKTLLKLVGLTIILITVLGAIYPDLVLTRLSQDTRLEIKSNQERISSYVVARDLIKDNWFLGVGAGNYAQYLHKINPGLKSWDYQPAHNIFLLVWAEIGIFGLILFLLIPFITCYVLWKIGQEGDKIEFYKISLVAAIFIMFLFDHWWWSGHFGLLLFWFIMGLVLKKETD